MDADNRPVLIAVITATVLTGLDLTVVATCTPRIVAELGGRELYGGVASAYFMGSAIFLPIGGRAAEVFPARRVFMGSLTLFLVSSVLCAMAPAMGWLIAARALQGVGGGAMFSAAGALVGLMFSSREQARIYGYKSLAFAVASAAGPTLGGYLSEALSWRAVFLINPPLALLALYLVATRMAEVAPVSRAPFDYRGAVGLATWSLLLLLAFTLAGAWMPWTSPPILGILAACLCAFVAFWRRESSVEAPLFDPHLLSNAVFRQAAAAFWCVGGCFMGTVIYLPLFLGELRHMTSAAAGTAMTPLILGSTIGAMIAGQAAYRFGRYKILMLFSAALCIGLLWTLLRALPSSPITVCVALMAGLGVTFGVMLVLYPLCAQNSVDASRQGTVAGSIQFFQQMGATMATAFLGTLLVASPEAAAVHVFTGTIALAAACLLATLFLPDVPLRSHALVHHDPS